MALVEVHNLVQAFELDTGMLGTLRFEGGRLIRRPRVVSAVDGVSFEIDRGQVFSLVGESGCGKSTVARTVIKLLPPKGGKILYNGTDITAYTKHQMLPLRKHIQMIFQDPYASLNPRQPVREILTEPMLFHGTASTAAEADKRALALLQRVGIRPEQAGRYPHQFSGGQRQRIGIARALAVEPELIVADEPVSALDVSIQAQILNLLMDLREEYGFSCLFIAHDLSVVRHISDRVAIMYLGRIAETGDTTQIFANPCHPYTEALFSAVPKLSGGHILNASPLEGEVPSAMDPPSGCRFRTRCPRALPLCADSVPIPREIEPGHMVFCHRID
ncbi:MAG: ABC transporter ATP-binding protein [Dethiosulfovibrio peptidovorans]|nr:MAG: ABC transporter ATP-binding protein [Dethiosulfovibrio peptidovorans]